MDNEIQERVKSCFSLMSDIPSKIIYSGQVYYNITGDYAYIAKMLRPLFLEFREYIKSQNLIETFAHCLEDLNNLRPLKSFIVDHDNMFFDPGLITTGKNEVFIDCGALDMSTSLEFAYNSKDTYKKIVAFEPDPICQEVCQDNLMFFSKDKRDNVKLFDFGVSDYNGNAPFERSSVFGNSRVIEESEENIKVKKIDDIEECADATFIKIHVEGTEFNVLKGAEKTIKRNRPTIAASCYHNINELLDIPIFLKQLVPDYDLYMRHYSTGTSESVLYAIDTSKT
jgi:FkbM family methyltransferase